MDEALKFPAKTFHSSPVSGAVGLAGYIGSLAGLRKRHCFRNRRHYQQCLDHLSRQAGDHPRMEDSLERALLPALGRHRLHRRGGGSIGWVDKGGILNVGPQSMGAVPGPACYGAGGTEPTNTDTQIVLGRIDPDYYLGGEMQVDAKLVAQGARSERSVEHYGWDAETSAPPICTWSR